MLDTIILDPDAIHPGAEIILMAQASDPDGDSITYRWSTYPAAAKFSDTTCPVCTVTVSTFLKGGMFLKVALDISDGKTVVRDSIWVPIVAGEVIWGHVYFANTLFPIPGTEVFVRRLMDTSMYSGLYAVHHVPPGERTIEAAKSGCDPYSADLSVADSINHDIFMICPELAKTVSGNIATVGSVNLESIRVTVLDANKSESGLSAVTDVNGDFTIDMVPPGKRLFAIGDAGNPDFDVLPDTFEIQIDNDTTVFLRGKVRRVVFVSSGIDSPDSWIFEEDGFWRSWFIDSANACLGYNSCQTFGVGGRLRMAFDIPIPSDADRLSWTIDVGYDSALCAISYVIDGVVGNEVAIASGTGDLIDDRVADTGRINPAGRNFAVRFYGWPIGSGECGTICLRHFTLSYYQ
ncbi:MAG: hypothetical protein JSU69_04995 [Candidatus Zixiibacteriota bacterium]|nr:MAG: hypothetical protein JSU69_04995 [candidate division Zixibacteria bacterium]